jgi:hypothetical protein
MLGMRRNLLRSIHSNVCTEWFEKEANQVDPEKNRMEDRLVELYMDWKGQMETFSTTS